MTRLVDKLGRQENAHLVIGHRSDVRRERIGDTLLALEEGAEAKEAHAPLLLWHILPLLAVNGEVDPLRAPLLALPAVI